MDWMVRSCAPAAVQIATARDTERKSLFTGGLQGEVKRESVTLTAEDAKDAEKYSEL